MIVTVNGHEKEFEDCFTVAYLLNAMHVESTKVAVEVNGRIIQRSLHKEHMIKHGDEVELVEFIGGG